MSRVIVERAFEARQTYAQLQSQEAGVAACLANYGVQPRGSFLSRDRLSMVSMYDAPDAEAVRTTQRAAGLSVQHLWSCTPIVDAHTPPLPGYSLVVVQRALPSDTTLEHVQYLATDPSGCGKRLKLQHIGAYLALDCRRMCCVYYSPDLESVRISSRETGVPVERLWLAERG